MWSQWIKLLATKFMKVQLHIGNFIIEEEKLNIYEIQDEALKQFGWLFLGNFMEFCLSPKSSILIKFFIKRWIILNWESISINFSVTSASSLGGYLWSSVLTTKLFRGVASHFTRKEGIVAHIPCPPPRCQIQGGGRWEKSASISTTHVLMIVMQMSKHWVCDGEAALSNYEAHCPITISSFLLHQTNWSACLGRSGTVIGSVIDKIELLGYKLGS